LHSSGSPGTGDSWLKSPQQISWIPPKAGLKARLSTLPALSALFVACMAHRHPRWWDSGGPRTSRTVASIQSRNSAETIPT
jgi:hypothetical protein